MDIREAQARTAAYIYLPKDLPMPMMSETEVNDKLKAGILSDGDMFIKIGVVKKLKAVKSDIVLKPMD